MASHGRIPGLVTQDRPRRQGAVPRSPARQAVPAPTAPDPPPGIPACVRSGCWRVRHCPEKACAVITLPPSLPAQAFAPLGHTAAGRVSLAGQRTDRPGNDAPGSEPSPAQARTDHGCPIPRDEPAEPPSEPCAPIANATGCPACISMHCSRVRKCALMPPSGRVSREVSAK